MAKPSIELIRAIRGASDAIAFSEDYQWGHMGSCNCGFLAQQISKLDKNEIHTRAMQSHGDWNEQLNDYCPTSGLLMDDLISQLLKAGLDVEDLKHLEKLSDNKVLQMLPGKKRHLVHNSKSDAIQYLECWADLLETELIDISTLSKTNGKQKAKAIPINERS